MPGTPLFGEGINPSESDKIKRSFFPSNSRVDTAIWMHNMDAN